MRLEETNYDNSETGCCAVLDVERWDEREFEWHDRLFLRDHIRSFLHIPLNFGAVISRDHELVEGAQAYPDVPLWLTEEVSPWGADVYVALDRKVPGAEMEKISGRFLTKVFEGPYRNIGKWTRDMENYVTARRQTVRKLFYYYATCPKCAKHFGKNHVVLFAQTH